MPLSLLLVLTSIKYFLYHKVREILSSKDNLFRQSNLWNMIPKGKFQIKKYKSPSTQLKIKVFQFPPQFPIRNNNEGDDVKTNASYIYGVRSIHKGPKNFISLGILPVSFEVTKK